MQGVRDETSIETLQKLASNPHYKLNEKQLKVLEDHRTKKKPVFHKTGIQKHNPQITNRHDGLELNNNERPNRD